MFGNVMLRTSPATHKRDARALVFVRGLVLLIPIANPHEHRQSECRLGDGTPPSCSPRRPDTLFPPSSILVALMIIKSPNAPISPCNSLPYLAILTNPLAVYATEFPEVQTHSHSTPTRKHRPSGACMFSTPTTKLAPLQLLAPILSHVGGG
ncbi:hypothetical protein B0J18DRAFT_431794 [Chaetomium sp. MPI-SDFR-AT-0129]|nr:hypothetical protein B0J18DRAFT_431794 [Chaetomium sp. MPI-SDFR-AT-0129]